MSGTPHRVEGFPPIARRDARVLVLGSMPSVASLAAAQYYGHPRNGFWPLMGALFGFEPEAPYAERCARLQAARVAVWDVLQACERPGSLDSAIRRASERPNDLRGFLRAHPDIAAVFLNGRKAEEAWRRHVARPAREASESLPPAAVLPSTSPAMAALDLAAKRERWRAVAVAAAPAPARGIRRA